MTFSMGCGMRSEGEGEGSFNYRSRSYTPILIVQPRVRHR